MTYFPSPSAKPDASTNFSAWSLTPLAATIDHRWSLRFDVSLNEEHVFLRLLRGGFAVADLGERVHHYSLLVLARLRLADELLGMDASSCGWVETDGLMRMLGLDCNHFNIQMLRARRQLLQASPAGYGMPALIERRRGEVRFGDFGIGIMRGATVEAPIPGVATAMGRNAA
jgi:hypothetical protein